MTDEPLAPCPCCASDRILTFPANEQWHVACDNCGLNIACHFDDGEAKAIAAWNTRARPSPPASAVPPEVDALIHKSMPRDFERKYDVAPPASADLVEVAARAIKDQIVMDMASAREAAQAVLAAVAPLIEAKLRSTEQRISEDEALVSQTLEVAREAYGAAQAREDAQTALAHIETLRDGPGHSVTILCNNDEATYKHEQMAVEVTAEWTDWQPLRFYGENVLQCLIGAVQARALKGPQP